MAELKVCPLCKVHVKIDSKGKFIQHERYVATAGTWIRGSVCKKSGKKP
jgi:hypothetical protein